jgi:hypothetical protein
MTSLKRRTLFVTGEEVLRTHAANDFSHYKYDPSAEREPDLFLGR